MIMLVQSAVTRKHRHMASQRSVVGDDCARISEGAEVLARIEREGCGRTESADRSAPIFSKMGLCGIFDHPQTMAFRQGEDRIHVRRLAAEVNGNDANSPWRDEVCETLDIDRE